MLVYLLVNAPESCFVSQAGGGLQNYSSMRADTKQRVDIMQAGSGIFGGVNSCTF